MKKWIKISGGEYISRDAITKIVLDSPDHPDIWFVEFYMGKEIKTLRFLSFKSAKEYLDNFIKESELC